MSDDQLFELRTIRARLDTIEHTQEVLVRADVDRIWGPLKAEFEKDRLLAKTFLLVDGSLQQREIVTALNEQGESVSEATVSRKLGKLRGLDLIQLIPRVGLGRVYAPMRVEKILRIKKRVQSILDSDSTRQEVSDGEA